MEGWGNTRVRPAGEPDPLVSLCPYKAVYKQENLLTRSEKSMTSGNVLSRSCKHEVGNQSHFLHGGWEVDKMYNNYFICRA